MNLLSIDPGVTCCGWAYWRDGKLVLCGLSRTKEVGIEARICAHDFRRHWLYGQPDFIVIEKPEVYQQRFWKGDPRDLVELAMVVGGIIAQFPGVRVRAVFPKEWKRQVPKSVSESRTLAKLSELEKNKSESPEVFGEPDTAPPSLLHNMMDAIGIGLWALGR
jgi:hypothetical protein